VAELQGEVTRARATIVMAGVRTARAERMAQERVILLASTHGKADVAARKVSLLEGELAVVRQAWDTTKAKLLDLVDKAATTDQRQEETEG
jgi:hypothetical protein